MTSISALLRRWLSEEGTEADRPRGRSAGERSWWHPANVLPKLVGVAIGAIGGQMVLPDIAPYGEMWFYSLTGIAVGSPGFLVSATGQEVADATKPAQTDPDFYRIFCGFVTKPAKYCVMRSLDGEDGVPPRAWRFAEKKHTKAVLLGNQSSVSTIVWLSQYSGSGGSAFAQTDIGNGSFVGYGIGCNPGDPPIPTPIRVLFGELPNDIRKVNAPALDAVKSSVLLAMRASKTVVEISQTQTCKRQLPTIKPST